MGRKIAISVNTVMALTLAFLLVLMVNYLSGRHYFRTDLSRARHYQLSEKTLNLLAGLTNPVNVIVFFQPQQELYDDVDNLLKEYAYASSLIQVEKVDPDRDLARTEELTRKYHVDQPNVVVFETAEQARFVTANDIMEYDYSQVPYGQMPEKVAFRGEEAFSSAIYGITQQHKPIVYFLQGHGERDVNNFSRSAGFSDIARAIQQDNIEIRNLLLGKEQRIPDDCDALVIAGPENSISEPELNLIRAYLDQKGRMMVMLDAMTKTGLEPLLVQWGVRVSEDVVLDLSRTLTGRELFINEYGPHPITRRLAGETSIFYLPRSVEPLNPADQTADSPDKPRVISLAACSAAGWAETDLIRKPMKYDAGIDRPGPVSVAVASEKGPIPGMAVQIPPTRLVVFGDSDFASNAGLSGGNSDFFLNALNWLLEREQLLGISAKPVEQNRLIMTQADLRMLFWGVVAGLPGLVALVGIWVWFRRRV